MARIRTIKPEFWTNERVMECSMLARLLFIGMWNFADDLGRLPLSAKSIKAQIFPSDDVDASSIRRLIDELSSNGLLLLYEVDGREFIQITGWQHQKIDRPQPGKCPAPINGFKPKINPEIAEHSTNDRRTLATEGNGREGSGGEGNSEANASGADAPVDLRADLFDRGLKTLGRITGKGPDACRSFVGKCLKAAGDDAVVVLGLIEDADRNRVADPSAWIVASLKTKGNLDAKPKNAIIQAADDLARKIAGFDGPPRGPDELRGQASAAPVRLLSHG